MAGKSKRTKKSDVAVVEETSKLPVPVGVVSLAEQDAQIERLTVAERGVESAGDAAAEPLFPWDAWGELEMAECGVDDLRVEAADKALNLIVPGYDPTPVDRIVFGRVGWLAGFPEEFVLKLSPRVGAEVINERLSQARGRKINMVRENDRWVACSPETRELFPAKELASTIYETLTAQYGGASWLDEIPEEPHYEGGILNMRFLTPVRGSVQRQLDDAKIQNLHYKPEDDILNMGFHVRQAYGEPLEVALFVNRVLCVNGILVERKECLWIGDQRKKSNQKAWLIERIEALPDLFARTLEGASRLASTPIGEGTIKALLEGYGRRHNIQARYVPFAVDAWNAQVKDEGEDRTEWGLANAFTRAFRDLRGDSRFGGRVLNDQMAHAGTAVFGQNLVKARIKHVDAVRLHAEILDE